MDKLSSRLAGLFLILISRCCCFNVKQHFNFGMAAKEKANSVGIFKNGTFVIGGLFAIHFQKRNTSSEIHCEGQFNQRGYEEAMAMLYAVNVINKNTHLLPGITLGVDIKDTCNSVDFAIRKSLNFSFIEKNVEASSCPHMDDQVAQTIAIVGPGSSDIAIAVTNLAGLFHVPVIDYASSSRLLSNKVRFKYFLRTSSSDALMSRATVDLLHAMKWNLIHVLYSDTDYGRSAIETFEYVLKATIQVKICFATKSAFNIYSDYESRLQTILEGIKARPRARVIVLLATIPDAEFILNRFESEGMEEYLFIGNDYYSGKVDQFKASPNMLRRVLGIVPHVVRGRLEGYAAELSNISVHATTAHNWADEYRIVKEGHRANNTDSSPSLYVPYALDAVYAIAHGLHNMLDCSANTCKISPQRFTDFHWMDDMFLKSIKSVKFPGYSRDPVAFDKYGNGIGNYDITVVSTLTGEWEKFGSWSSNTSNVLEIARNTSQLELNRNRLREVLELFYNNTGIPTSSCGKACYPGFWTKPEETNQRCCWQCVPCTGNEISHMPPNGSCHSCPEHYWPNQNHTRCDSIVPTSVTLRDPPGIAVTLIATLGTIIVILVAMVFCRHSNTHMVRASSRLLSFIMLFGIALGYMTAIMIFINKTETLCRTVLYLFSVSFSIVVGTLLTKTNRIHRIFSKKAMRKGTPPCLSDRWMVMFITGFVSIEIAICTIIVYTTADGSLLEIIYSTMKNEAFLQCKFYATYADYHMAVWWTYNTGIVLVCTYQAYLTRKVPGNYNEARFIAFTMITISTDVLVFFLSYYGTRGFYKDVLVGSFLIVADTITLCCVFLPKVYVILLKPEKNVAHGSIRNLGTLDHVNYEEAGMRKISHVSQRSCVSYISDTSASSGNHVTDNVNSTVEPNRESKNMQQKRKMSVRNHVYLDSGQSSVPGSNETMLDSIDPPLENTTNHEPIVLPISGDERRVISRMSSDLSARSVRFEDEVAAVVIEDWDPKFYERFEYRHRDYTI